MFSISLFLIAGAVLAQSQPDTALAGEYFAKAKKLARQAHYDSSNIYYDRAGKIYEKTAPEKNDPGLWEKYIRCYNGLGVNSRRQGHYDRALNYLNKALTVGLDKLGPHKVWRLRPATRESGWCTA
jgi:tetratricopeptide (TPR) repeat protein